MRGPYLYQTIHLRGRRPLQVDRHAELLGEWAAELFGIGYAPDARDLERRIAALAERERYPRDLSSFVRLELGADGAERLLAAGISLYEGPALRSVTPDAVVVEFSSPLAEAPTSAREAAAALARVQ
ncbi:MAG TPA: branched-chain amino acid aminotransferase, partial [Alistipes sp.]|nr:branched-chain amino acid aminotransferase [Alistipes sp.]